MEHDFSKVKMYEACLMYVNADRVLRGIIEEQLRDFDMSLTDWLMLGVIDGGPTSGITLSDIAVALGVSQPQVTMLMANAIQLGLVRQRVGKKDRRSRTAVLTVKGKRLLDSIEEKVKDFMKVWLSEIPSQQLMAYSQSVVRIANYHRFLE